MVVQNSLRERAVLELLKERYQSEGYSFFEYPSQDITPSFLEGYRPDAIAVGPAGRVVIEVRSHRKASDISLAAVADRFLGNSDWKFEVVYAEDLGEEVGTQLTVPTVNQVISQIPEVESLLASGHPKAAFLVGWGLLEAAARIAAQEGRGGSARSKPPRQVVNYLEQEGFLAASDAGDLRKLIDTRNALVHGGLNVIVSPNDVAVLLNVIRLLVDELETQPDLTH